MYLEDNSFKHVLAELNFYAKKQTYQMGARKISKAQNDQRITRSCYHIM